jgi:hypothetical protein
MDRFISQNGVAALLDAKIDRLNALLGNPLCKGMDRKIVAAQVGALLSVRAQLDLVADETTFDAGGEFPIDLNGGSAVTIL